MADHVPLWTLKVPLNRANGRQHFMSFEVYPEGISMLAGHTQNGRTFSSDPAVLTANMAGDLAHALEEAIRHLA